MFAGSGLKLINEDILLNVGDYVSTINPQSTTNRLELALAYMKGSDKQKSLIYIKSSNFARTILIHRGDSHPIDFYEYLYPTASTFRVMSIDKNIVIPVIGMNTIFTAIELKEVELIPQNVEIKAISGRIYNPMIFFPYEYKGLRPIIGISNTCQ